MGFGGCAPGAPVGAAGRAPVPAVEPQCGLSWARYPAAAPCYKRPMKSFVVVGVALSLAACHKQSASGPSAQLPSAPASTSDVDALWALAPDGATMGIVVSPRGLTMAEHAWQDIMSFVKSVPELAPSMPKLQQALQKELGTPTLSLAAVGLVPSKGLATFGITKDSTVLILPVGDRDKFLAVARGTKGPDFDTLGKLKCKTVRGLYACAQEPARLDTLGKGKLQPRLAEAGARGDIEVAGTIDSTRFAIVAQLARGAFVLRGTVDVDGLPNEWKGGLGLAKPYAASDAAGFGLVAMQPVIAKLAGSIPRTPIAPGVTLRDVVASLAGVVTFNAPGGTNELDARVALRDPAPMTALVEHCEDLPIGGKLVAGKCHVSNPQLKGLTPDVWVEGNELHVRVELPVARGGSAPLSALGAELASGEWSMAFWGRGTGLTSGYDASTALDPSKLADPEVKIGLAVGLRALALVNELGGGFALDGDRLRFMWGVRTAWGNPDDVVAKLIAIDPQDILHGRSGAAAQAIASAAPTSSFAADVRAGTHGIVVAVMPLAMIATVAVNAFHDYMKRSKVPERP
jgi:hypothetical protein